MTFWLSNRKLARPTKFSFGCIDSRQVKRRLVHPHYSFRATCFGKMFHILSFVANFSFPQIMNHLKCLISFSNTRISSTQSVSRCDKSIAQQTRRLPNYHCATLDILHHKHYEIYWVLEESVNKCFPSLGTFMRILKQEI